MSGTIDAVGLLSQESEALRVFTGKIHREFGDAGREWLKGMASLLQGAIDHWGLGDCRLAPSMSYNLIVFAESPVFGPVAVKLGFPHPELYSEMKALAIFDGRGTCRLHATREDLGCMLLERVSPGHTLDIITASRDRITTGVRVITGLPRITVTAGGSDGLMIYRDWLDRAFDRARREGRVGERMLPLIDAAEALFHAHGDRPNVLLHGDLHHENMLVGEDGKWVAIDPKGAVGPSFMEAARFIENELDRLPGDQAPDAYRFMVREFAGAMGEDPAVIAQGAFILRVLGTCWSFEGYVDPASLTEHVDSCEWFRDAMSSLR